jgi:hypothetical protein
MENEEPAKKGWGRPGVITALVWIAWMVFFTVGQFGERVNGVLESLNLILGAGRIAKLTVFFHATGWLFAGYLLANIVVLGYWVWKCLSIKGRPRFGEILVTFLFYWIFLLPKGYYAVNVFEWAGEILALIAITVVWAGRVVRALVDRGQGGRVTAMGAITGIFAWLAIPVLIGYGLSREYMLLFYLPSYREIPGQRLQLMEGIDSYQSVASFKKYCTERGLKWRMGKPQFLKRKAPASMKLLEWVEPQCRADFIVVDSFVDQGIRGKLEAKFFNDRLGNLYFYPPKYEEYLKKLDGKYPEKIRINEWFDTDANIGDLVVTISGLHKNILTGKTIPEPHYQVLYRDQRMQKEKRVSLGRWRCLSRAYAPKVTYDDDEQRYWTGVF